MTTRRFPRTLHEAFPRDARHAYAIERHPSLNERIADVFLAVVIGVFAAISLAVWWGGL